MKLTPPSEPTLRLSTAEMMAAIQAMDPEAKKELDAFLLAGDAPIWVPQDGPQLMAYLSQADIVFYGGAAGGGKGLSLDTPLPTPVGWTTMGAVRPGDELLAPDGRPCVVTAATPVQHRACYRLTFDDGSQLVADDVHRWVTFDAAELQRLSKTPEWRARRRATRPSAAKGNKSAAFTAAIAARNAARVHTHRPPEGTMRDTAQLAATLRTSTGRANHAIKLTEPLALPPAELPVPPYTLGAWLGDGSSRNGQFTGEDDCILDRIRADGFEVRTYDWSDIAHNIIGLKVQLRAAGVLGAKHIPMAYLRASRDQRLALLQGLMDTDGHAAMDGGCEFDGINEKLVDGVLELALSLGIKATKLRGVATLDGRVIGPKWRVRFTTSMPVFGLERKAQRLKAQTRRTTAFRYLVACDPIESVPTRCIAVDSPSRQFLAGRAMVPTHNTDLLLGLCLTSQEHSIIFRREAVQLTGIEERMTKILGTRKGYNSQDGVWRLPGNKVMELGSVKEPGDWIKYQGRAHDMKCVGRGTPVLMADGSYRAIEDVRVGDLVQTIEGPRKVTRTMTQRKDAVVLRVTGDKGQLLASQVQSSSHQILGPCGWVSQDTLTYPDASSPTQRHCACKCEESSSQTCSLAASTPSAQCPCLAPPPAQSQDRAGYQSSSGFCAGEARTNRGICCEASVCQRAKGAQHSSETCHQEHQSPSPVLSGRDCAPPSCDRDAPGVLAGSSPQDCQGRCSSCSHLCDEQPRLAEVAAPGWSLQQVGAAQQTPNCFAEDAQGRTPTRTRRMWSYTHPYTKENRQIEAVFCEVSWAFSCIGEAELFDLTVDGANSYITAGGIVNRNCFDEITHFTESQFRTLIGWLRTDKPDVRQRVVAAGNPPTTAEGEWVKRFWAAWLDPNHPNPAKPGELRWYVSDEKGEDREVPNGDPVMVGTDLVKPKSRTFIPSSVDDNLFLLSTGYKETLRALPEPLRSQMLRGDFQAGAADPAWQTIPTEWVKEAQARWADKQAKGTMTAIGFDPARGGIDKSTLARRHGQWFDKLVTAPGIVTKDGPTAAAFVVPYVRDGACICVDSIGIGSSALDFIKGLNLNVLAVNGSEASGQLTVAGNLRFRNKRAEMYWKLREALDPTNPDPIALPPDAELLADLTAVRYKVVTMGKVTALQMRDKDEIREMLGRSPDKGDAVAMTFISGIPAPNSQRSQYEEPPPPDWRT